MWLDAARTELPLLGLAFVLSAVIGLERQFHQKSAGLRTHVLVALGSATFTLVSAHGFRDVVGADAIVDPTRIAAQVVSGIGFLGAGVIFTRQDVVRGLTTAASVWVSAAVGMACGAGMPELATGVTVLLLLTLVVVSPLARRLPTRDTGRVVELTYRDGRGVLREVLSTATRQGFSAAVDSTRAVDPDSPAPKALVRFRFRGSGALSDLVLALGEVPGVTRVVARRDEEDEDDQD